MKKTYDFNRKDGTMKESLRLGAIACAVIAIVILINAIAALFPLRADMTSENLYSLSEQTKNILLDNDEEVTITCLFDRYSLPSNDKYVEIVRLLDEYAKDENIEVKYVDPDASPGIISELDPSGLYELTEGSFAVKCADKMRIISSSDLFSMDIDYTTLTTSLTQTTAEQAFSGAISYVASKEEKTLYLLGGHDEDDVLKNYSVVMGYIRSSGFEVKNINLLTDALTLGEGDVLLCASPKADLSDAELSALSGYIKDGAKAIFMFSALDTAQEFQNWNELLSAVNIQLNSDVVIETNSSMFAAGNPYLFISHVKDENGELSGGSESIILAKAARSIRILDNKKDYLDVRKIVYTSDTARSIPIDDKEKYVDAQHVIGAAAQAKIGEKKSRIVVLGSAEFADDSTLKQYTSTVSNYNIHLLLDSISWVREDEVYEAVPAKDYTDGSILITGAQANIASIIIIGIIPGIILAVGIAVFIRRRHL